MNLVLMALMPNYCRLLFFTLYFTMKLEGILWAHAMQILIVDTCIFRENDRFVKKTIFFNLRKS